MSTVATALGERDDGHSDPDGTFPCVGLDVWRGLVLLATIVLCALAFSLRLTSFLIAKEAVLNAGLAAMALLAARRGRMDAQGFRAFAPLWFMLGAAAVVHLVIRPAQVPSDAWVELARMATLLFAVAVVWDLLAHEVWRERVTTAILASTVAVALLALAQYAGLANALFPVFTTYSQRMYSVFGNQDLLGGYVAMGLAMAVVRFGRSRKFDAFSAMTIPVLTVCLVLSGCRSAWIAAVVGVGVAASVVPRQPRRMMAPGALMALAGTVALAVAPEGLVSRLMGTLGSGDVGGRARLWFWAGTVGMIRAHPFVGVGPGQYAYWSPRYLGDALAAPGGERLFHDQLHVDHAHSEPLELAAELGLVGLVFGVWMLVRLGRRRGPEWPAIVSLMVFSLFNAGLHSAPHAFAGLLLAGMLLARREPAPKPMSIAVSWLAGALAVALACFFAWSSLAPSYLLRVAMDAHIEGRSPLALYERAVRFPWPDATAHDKYGIALSEAGRNAEAKAHLEQALKGLDTGEVYLSLGVLAFRRGDAPETRRMMEACLYRWPSCGGAWKLFLWATPEEEREKVKERARRWGVEGM